MQLANELLNWETHVEASKRDGWHQRIVDFQLQCHKMSLAMRDKPSVAAYGESQMGKSYLISAMLGERKNRFRLSDGKESYDFIDEINPSDPNSKNEATGIVTRFLRRRTGQQAPENGWLRVRLLSVADLVLILAEAWCIETNRPAEDLHQYLSMVEEHKKAIRLQASPVGTPFISEIDLAYIQESLEAGDARLNHIVTSGIFTFLRGAHGRVDRADMISLIKLVWNNNEHFNKLFDDLIKYREELGASDSCLVEFESIIRKSGTLLDVQRLEEMYTPKNKKDFPDHKPDLKVRTSDGRELTMPKSFFSALTAELEVDVDSAGRIDNRSFLDNLDILDFPGLKGSLHMGMSILGAGSNMAYVFRRGKVTYLFRMYSSTKRISLLLFCQNHNDYTVGTLGEVLQNWIYTNIGTSPTERSAVEKDMHGSPLLVISTYFNQNLETGNEHADLNERWYRRFVSVLSTQVLKSNDLPDHWFNNWTDGVFRNIFLLRDFKFSKSIFNEPTNEEDAEGGAKDPHFLERLEKSFLSNSFVLERFGEDRAKKQWAEAATPNNDGTRPIIESLKAMAPEAATARNAKFCRNIDVLKKQLLMQIDEEYKSDDPAKASAKAKKDAAAIVRAIDREQSKNSLFFTRLLYSLAIPEIRVREKVFAILNGNETSTDTPKSIGAGSTIVMNAGILPSDEEKVKIRKLCDYYGVDSKEEVSELLKEEEGVDLKVLLGTGQIFKDRSEQLVEKVEELWLTDYLNNTVSPLWRGNFQKIDSIVGKLGEMWKSVEGHKQLTDEVRGLMNRLRDGQQVGIVANWIASRLRCFVLDFGYSWIERSPEDLLAQARKKNEEYRMGILFELCQDAKAMSNAEMITSIARATDILSRPREENDTRHWEYDIPEQRDRLQWEHRLRLAFAITSGLRNCDFNANAELGKIRKDVEKILEEENTL